MPDWPWPKDSILEKLYGKDRDEYLRRVLENLPHPDQS